jgi:tRNA threonylcarbamoyladenosine biosynthesis protein TsaB
MRVLALDTSHANGSVALVVTGETPWSCEVVASASARVSNAHGESLLPLVETTLKNARVAMSEVDLVAVGVGPGSFTGTRVGVATAKGLALGARKPLRGVEGFDALAADARAPVGAEVAVAIDARKGEVYLAVCRVDAADVVRLVDPIHAAPAEAWSRMGRALPSHVAGDGVSLVPELAARAPARVGIESPRAAAIAALAGVRQRVAPVDEIDVLEPLYVRPPDVTLPKTQPGMPHRRG